MTKTDQLPNKRREELVALMQQRGQLLSLSRALITNALVRCLPREGDAIAIPNSRRLAVPTQVANAPTERGDEHDQRIELNDDAEQAAGRIPQSINKPQGANMPSSGYTTGTKPRPGTGSIRRQTGTSSRMSKIIRDAFAPISVDQAATEKPEAQTQLNNDRVPDKSVEALTPRALAKIEDVQDDSGQWDALNDGTIIAGYRIESPLGAGAMGQVYKAMQLSMNRAVAFKVLAPKLSNNRKFRDRFLREARAAGRLHHPNLIAVHDVGEADGLMFFSMELVDGTTVGELLQRHGRIPESRALEICRQTLEALKFAHAAGVVHRDIKPDNLMVTKSGMVKVADLGLARAEQSEDGDASLTATNTGAVMGTPHYMAPEQGRDAHRVDHRADLYAVGATMFHLVCGSPPFIGNSAMEVLVRSTNNPLKFPEPGPSPAIRVFISRLMEKDPSRRPQSAAEVLELVSKLRRKQIEEDPEMAGDAVTAVARVRARRVRRTIRKVSFYAFAVTVAMVIILFILGISGGWQWRNMIHEAIELSEEHNYNDAIALLDRQTTTWTSRQNELNRVRGEINNAWDSWAYNQAQTPMRKFQEQLRAQSLGEAYATLQGIGAPLRSAKVQKDIEEFQRQWEASMMAEEVRKSPAQLEEEKVRELWPLEYLNHLGHDLLVLFTYNPKTNAVLHENTVRLTGNGRAFTEDTPKILAGRSLRLIVKFVEKELQADRWEMIFAGGRRMVINREGIRVTGTGGDDVVLQQAAMQHSFTIRNDRKSVEIQLNDSDAWVPIASATERIEFAWELNDKHAVDLKVRVVPLGYVPSTNKGNKLFLR
jgi:Protein kinase domain